MCVSPCFGVLVVSESEILLALIQNKGLDTYACLVWCGRSNNTQCDVTVAIVSDSM